MTETFKLTDQLFLSQLPVPFLKEGVSVFFRNNALVEEMRDTHENAVSDGHARTFFSSSSSDATKLGWQRAVLLACYHMSCLKEEAQQPGIAFPGFARQPFPRTFVVSRTDSSPGGYVSRRGKWPHIHANLCENPGSCTFTDAWDTTPQDSCLCPTEPLF